MVRSVTHDDIGLKVLHEAPPEAVDVIDIVAIHGIGAHPDDTWCRNVGTADNPRWTNWLVEENMLRALAPNLRIMRYGYQSQWFGKDAMRQKASVVAHRLLLALKRKRVEFPYRPLIFIAHCFGGLIVLKALLDARYDTGEWPGTFISTTGLLFFGTPFRGAEGMSLMEMLEAARSEYHEDEVQPDVLRILEPGNEFLQELVDQFGKTRKLANKAQVACFYELKSSNIGKIVGKEDRTRFVVNESSGCLDLSEGTSKFSLSRTHFDMNKFAKPTEEDFETVSEVLKGMIGSSHGLALARFQYNKHSRETQDTTAIDQLHSCGSTLGNTPRPFITLLIRSGTNQFEYILPGSSLGHENTLIGLQKPTKGVDQISKQLQFYLEQHTDLVAKELSFSGPLPKERNRQDECIFSYRSPYWLWYFGFLGSIVQKKRRKDDVFSVSIRYRPPNRRTRLISVDFTFRFTQNPWKVSDLHSNLMMPLNIIPNDSEIIQACKYGWLEVARKLFREKAASVYDVTCANESLLCLAIEGGYVELVRFLLDQGADVNQTFGRNQTSPLQRALYLGMYDITRLLLHRKADGTHVSCHGWNPVVYLLHGAQTFEGTRTHTLLEFLDILNIVHVETDTISPPGNNVLQLAAAWYPGKVIERLFTLGASMALFGSNPWSYPGNPIWNAIYTNNTSSFQALLRHYPDVDAQDVDQHRMLSYTARNGNNEMTELLLEMGAEEIFPDYEMYNSENRFESVAADDEDSMGDLTEWTEKTHAAYLNILERFGRVTIRTNTEDGVDKDIYWTPNEDSAEWY